MDKKQLSEISKIMEAQLEQQLEALLNIFSNSFQRLFHGFQMLHRY